ncbi:hypothetical protein [Kineosporia succinea]|uniref:Uncharacterized protein n=1 Tax=Kineosporia succinea TaxID=84632 RepID=A0ABT9PCT9_9ACTN|nr:hypothetical protein [Kineosporia succinea]MDP9830533.1 hypothetical protein [Kineosporia succinea]
MSATAARRLGWLPGMLAVAALIPCPFLVVVPVALGQNMAHHTVSP